MPFGHATPVSRAVRLATALLCVCALDACATVSPGHEAVVVSPGGSFSTLGEGTTAVAPGSQVVDFDLREEERDQDMVAITTDGAPVIARSSVVTFHIVREEIIPFAREIGADGYRVLVEPIVRSTVRQVIGYYTLVELTTRGIRSAQADVTEIARARLRPFHIVLDDVIIKGVMPMLPRTYAAILATSAEEQRALAGADRLAAAVGVATSLSVLAPNLAPGTLTDMKTRAWTRLLTAPQTHVAVVSAARRSIVEVTP